MDRALAMTVRTLATESTRCPDDVAAVATALAWAAGEYVAAISGSAAHLEEGIAAVQGLLADQARGRFVADHAPKGEG
jgi:hypothetical protein